MFAKGSFLAWLYEETFRWGHVLIGVINKRSRVVAGKLNPAASSAACSAL